MTEVVVEELEFAESKNASAAGNGGNAYGGGSYGGSGNGNYGGGSYGGNNGGNYGNAGGYSAPAQNTAPASDALDGFMNIPDGIDEELPFS